MIRILFLFFFLSNLAFSEDLKLICHYYSPSLIQRFKIVRTILNHLYWGDIFIYNNNHTALMVDLKTTVIFNKEHEDFYPKSTHEITFTNSTKESQYFEIIYSLCPYNNCKTIKLINIKIPSYQICNMSNTLQLSAAEIKSLSYFITTAHTNVFSDLFYHSKYCTDQVAVSKDRINEVNRSHTQCIVNFKY